MPGRRPILQVAVLLPLVIMLAFPAVTRGDQIISVTPTRIPLSIAAGEKAMTSLTLTNRGEEEMRILPQVLTVMEDEGGKISFGKGDDSGWVTLEQGELLLEPFLDRQVEVTVTPPADASPGLRRLALTFIQAPEGEGEIGVTGGLAVLLELDVLPAQDAVSSSFPIWLPVVSAIAFILATGALLGLQRHRKRGEGGESLPDDEGESE